MWSSIYKTDIPKSQVKSLSEERFPCCSRPQKKISGQSHTNIENYICIYIYIYLWRQIKRRALHFLNITNWMKSSGCCNILYKSPLVCIDSEVFVQAWLFYRWNLLVYVFSVSDELTNDDIFLTQFSNGLYWTDNTDSQINVKFFIGIK